jgi:hypothetical protein
MQLQQSIVLCLLLSSLLCRVPLGSSVSDSFWIYGTITTFPKIVTYNNVSYSEFTFMVNASDAVWITEYPTTMTVLIPVVLLVDIAVRAQLAMNLTGRVGILGIPDGVFVAEHINSGDEGPTDWRDTLTSLWITFTGITKLLVTLAVQLFETTTGIIVPTWSVSLIMVVLIIIFIVTLFKKLPLILFLIAFILCVIVIGLFVGSMF